MMINHLTSSIVVVILLLLKFQDSWLALGFLSLSYADDVELTGHATGQKKYTKKPASEMQDDHLVLSRKRSPSCNSTIREMGKPRLDS